MSTDDNHYQGLYVNAWEFIHFDLDYYRYSWYYEKVNDNISYKLVLGRISKYDIEHAKLPFCP